MLAAFESAGFSPTAQYPFDWYTIDFAFVDVRVAVECDGKYWHGRKEQRIKDVVKDKWLRKHGWIIIRLGEDEINESPEDCVAKVVRIAQRYSTMPLFASLIGKEVELDRQDPNHDPELRS